MAMTSQEIQSMFNHVNKEISETAKKDFTKSTQEEFTTYIEDQYKIDNNIFLYTISDDEGNEKSLFDILVSNMGGISDNALDFALKNGAADPIRLHQSVNENLRLASRLVDTGKLDVNAQDADGNTPLHLAKNELAVNFLINHGASFTVKNNCDKTAIDTIENEEALKALHTNISNMKKEKQNQTIALGVSGVSLIGAAVAGTIATLKINSVYNFAKDLFVKALGATNAKFFTPFVIATGALVGIAGAGLTAVAGKKAYDVKASGYTEALDKIDSKLAQFQTK